TGVGRYLKARKPGVKIVAVQPKDSPVLTEGRAGGHRIQGSRPNYVPAFLERSVIDDDVDAEFDPWIETSRRLSRDGGILGGVAAGAAARAALDLGQRPEHAGQTIVVVVPDTGERYLTTTLYQDPEPAEA